MRRSTPFLALGLVLLALTGDAGTAAQAPQIRKPIPAPNLPSTLPPLPPAYIDDQLAIGGDDVKARQVESRLTTEVRVNGRGPYHFIVDSGADTSAVGIRIAKDLQLPLGRPVILNAMTSRNIVDRVKVAELTMGPSTVRDLELPALREQDLGGHGMLGIDALVQQRLLMDFEERLIKVEDARKPVKALPGEIVVTARRQRGQLILTRVNAAGVPLEAVVDTGTEITIGNLPLRDKLLRRHRDKFVTIPVTDVSGVTKNVQLARIGELQLGSVTLRDVPIAFADLPPFRVFGLSKEPALLLGTDLLETFRRVSLDFRSRKVRFQLRRCGSSAWILRVSPTDGPMRLSSTNANVCRR
jgi:hypothetical protein